MDNTVGSLSQAQKSVVIGSLLGDGYLRKLKGKKNAFLEVNHSFKQKDYVDWKYSVLKSIVSSPPKQRKGNGKRIAYRFFTKQHTDLTFFLKQFYCDGKKIIPNISLTRLSLAVWFMDDGSLSRSSDIYLNTQQFDFEDQLKLVGFLKLFQLDSRLNKDKQYFRIRFLKSSLPRLKFLIDDYIIPSMRYKLDI